MKPVELELPWPPPALSPNARGHWATLARAKKRYRMACWIAAHEQKARLRGAGPWAVTFEFHPPPRADRAMDEDNLVARMKSGVDGVCDALKIDDKHLRLQPPVRGARTPEGLVRLRIAEIAP